jgi:hypothetical protein
MSMAADLAVDLSTGKVHCSPSLSAHVDKRALKFALSPMASEASAAPRMWANVWSRNFRSFTMSCGFHTCAISSRMWHFLAFL